MAFFSVVVPAYFLWALGLCAGVASYWAITRPACRTCGLPDAGPRGLGRRVTIGVSTEPMARRAS